MNQGRLTRSSTDKVIAGVCGGIARQFGIDPTLVRVAFVLLTLFAGISPWIYLLLWIIMPSDSSSASTFGQQVQQSLAEIQQKATKVVDQVSDKVQQYTGSTGSAGTPTPPTTPTPQVPDDHSHDGASTGPTTRL